MFRWWFTILVCSLVFLIPSNLFIAFANGTEFVHGLRVDYLIPKLYLSDIVAASIIISAALSSRSRWLKRLTNPKKNMQSLSTFGLAYVLIGMFMLRQFYSHLPLNSVMTLLHLGLIVLLMIVLLKNVTLINRSALTVTIAVTLLFQSGVALFQWWMQRSVYGYAFLGEVQYQFPLGLAKTTWQGREMILPYGTTAHPNILAGFIAVFSVFLIHWMLHNAQTKVHKTLLIVILALSFVTLFLTQSLSAVLAFGIGTTIAYFQKKTSNNKSALLYVKAHYFWTLICIASLLGIVSIQLISTSMNKNDSLIRRQRLNTAAIELFTKHPIQGTGLNNFTFSLDQSVSHGKVIVPFLQPAHNVFALLLAEVGLLGFGALFSIKYLLSKPILKSFQVGWFDTKLPWAYVMVAPIFILDHYLYTLQTGLLLMAFLPLFWKYPHSK